MNPDILSVLHVVALAAIAFVTIIIFGTIGFVFPRKCERCGKKWAFVTVKCSPTKILTAGEYIATDNYLSYKKCLNCGYHGKEEILCKVEKPTKD
jgi:hypothetical protein